MHEEAVAIHLTINEVNVDSMKEEIFSSQLVEVQVSITINDGTGDRRDKLREELWRMKFNLCKIKAYLCKIFAQKSNFPPSTNKKKPLKITCGDAGTTANKSDLYAGARLEFSASNEFSVCLWQVQARTSNLGVMDRATSY